MPEKGLDDYDAQDWASFQEEFGVEEDIDIYFQEDIENEVISNMELVYAGYL